MSQGARRAFNHLHLELSLLAGKNIPRMELWEEVSEFCDPTALTREVVLERYPQMREAFKHWDPSQETPEEIFERICGGMYGD